MLISVGYGYTGQVLDTSSCLRHLGKSLVTVNVVCRRSVKSIQIDRPLHSIISRHFLNFISNQIPLSFVIICWCPIEMYCHGQHSKPLKKAKLFNNFALLNACILRMCKTSVHFIIQFLSNNLIWLVTCTSFQYIYVCKSLYTSLYQCVIDVFNFYVWELPFAICCRMAYGSGSSFT